MMTKALTLSRAQVEELVKTGEITLEHPIVTPLKVRGDYRWLLEGPFSRLYEHFPDKERVLLAECTWQMGQTFWLRYCHCQRMAIDRGRDYYRYWYNTKADAELWLKVVTAIPVNVKPIVSDHPYPEGDPFVWKIKLISIPYESTHANRLQQRKSNALAQPDGVQGED